MAQEVTKGRIVYYKDSEERVFPAIVTNVNEEGAVNLQVFAIEKIYPALVVEQGENQGQWDWMPFQKDQQKSVEILEKKIEDLQSEVELPSEPEVEEEVPTYEEEPMVDQPAVEEITDPEVEENPADLTPNIASSEKEEEKEKELV